MGDLATSYSFTNNTTANAGEVNTNFSDIVNYVNARNSGAAKWDELKTSGDAVIDGSLTVDGVDVVSLVSSDGWIIPVETWTYASASSFTISGDKTGKYSKGDKIKLTQTTVKYFYILDVSYSSPNTTIKIYAGTDYTLANAAITSPFYSKQATPVGFPELFTFTPTVTGLSTTNHNVCWFTLHGKTIFINYRITGQSDSILFLIDLPTILLNTSIFTINPIAYAVDNGSDVGTTNPVVTVLSGSLVFATGGGVGSLWTASGIKSASGTFIGYIA